MRHSIALLVLLVALGAASAGAGQNPAQPSDAVQRSARVADGIAHFDKAFYDLTPHKRDAEAAREYALAIAAFESEIAARPASAEAHRYLGRIYGIEKDYKKAARHYDALAALEPTNADACVLAALAYAEDGQADEARARLVEAKDRTSDPGALARLDDYLAKLETLKR